jgi:hypothetical protein
MSSGNLGICGLGLVAAALILPAFAGAQDEPAERNFDIRLSQEKAAVSALEQRRLEKGATPASLLDPSALMADAVAGLAARVPSLDLVQSRETGAPEIVGIRGFARLTGPSEAPREEIARQFVEANSWVYGLSSAQAAALELDADYTNPAGNISWVRLKQRIHGLPMFRGDLTFALTPEGEIFRSMGQLAAALPSEIPEPAPKLSAAEAIAAAAAALGIDAKAEELVALEESNDGASAVFEAGPFAGETKIELVYFPLGPGAVELAWSMTLWQDVDAYYTLVSAEDGLLLFNKNITEQQTQSATYNVYGNANAYIDVADSPAPLTPGPIDPTLGTQGALLSRVNRTLIGNEPPNTFNDLGWITDGANGVNGWTDGNNVEAGIDVVAPDGVDSPVSGASRAFSFVYNPAPGSPAPGDAPTGPTFRNGAVTQLFYITNRYHDALYELGFTESAFNFQNDNFGRGGAGNDRIRAEAQDYSGTNNANFATPADGGRGRMQMFIWTGPDPDRDGTVDAEVVIHELTHGTSNRLHGNSSGLISNMSRGMGEGWGDFYAQTLLSEPSDPMNSTRGLGGYVTLGVTAGFTGNYYYGIRRFPQSVISFTGGPGNKPHNPLTFADLNVGCDLTDGAFAPGPIGSPTCDQVHNAGEVWSAALWEVRALMINRLGFAPGTERVLQVVTDGMKLNPVNPDFLQSRDAIIAAASAFSPVDVADVREGFRRRGMGFSAEVLATSPANVVEAFDFPNVKVAPPITVENVSCTDPGRNPSPGEAVTVSVPVENMTGSTVTNVVAALNGANSVFYGSIADGATVTKKIYYTIPAGSSCGTELALLVVLSSDAGVQAGEGIEIAVGESPTTIELFSNSAAIDIPGGQPATTSGPASPYPSAISVSGIIDPVVGATVTLHQLNHTWVGDVDALLVGPGGHNLVVMSDAFSASNRTGTVVTTLDLQDDAVGTMPSSGVPPSAGAFQPTNHGVTDVFDAPAPVGPYNDPAPAGAATFANIYGSLSGADVNGTWNLWIDDDAGGDPGSMDGGWTLGIVTSQLAGCLACAAPYCVPVLDVSDQTVGAVLGVTACQALTSSDFSVVGPNGDVTFLAGTSVALGDGFEVQSGAKFTAGNTP